MKKNKVNLWVTPGYRTALLDGCLVPESPFHMATELFYAVSENDYIECRDSAYVFAVATFSDVREEKYLYTYDYKQDSAWVTYRQDLKPDSYSQKTYVFEEDGFCRICLKRVDGNQITQEDADKINEILHFYVKEKEFSPKECFENEIADTVGKIRTIWNKINCDSASSQAVSLREKISGNGKNMRGEDREGEKAFNKTLSFALLTDSHYTVNGTWEDTADNIQKVLSSLNEDTDVSIRTKVDIASSTVENGECVEWNKEFPKRIDGIVHLGDFTDGMTTKLTTKHYVDKMLGDLKQNQIPVYVTLGNHDSNYFRGNKQRLSIKEQKELFGLNVEYYFQDFAEQKIRCLFLSSYDADTPVRYGFPREEVIWVKKVLEDTPEGYKVIIFSHEAPLADLDYWARLIRNGKELLTVLEEYNARPDKQILAYIHGHTHAEHVYLGSSFPIISIGCNKCEYFSDKKPKGSHAYERIPGTISQDLWDILVINGEEEKLYFVRFGAGVDRVVDCSKKESTWQQVEQEKRKQRKTKIWAHRGSSGFAPENTIPAFEVAKALNVDGIELDVQMTKDGELVVIHDETIDRTSDGKGWVKDYTLEELRKFNFAKNKPAFGFVTIPTLREVYELFQDTDYVINVELKTSIIPYDGSNVMADGRCEVDDDTLRNENAGGYRERQNLSRQCIEERVHLLTEEMGMTKQVIYSSFSHRSILKMQQYVTDEQTAFLFSDGWLNVTEYGVEYNVQALHPSLCYLDLKALVEKSHQNGMKVHVWTVNEEEHALQLKDIGVDAIITNHPGKMKDALL